MGEVSMYRGLPKLRTRTALGVGICSHRGTSLIRNNPPVGPYSSPMPRDLW